jgi:hypothetical protein
VEYGEELGIIMMRWWEWECVRIFFVLYKVWPVIFSFLWRRSKMDGMDSDSSVLQLLLLHFEEAGENRELSLSLSRAF